MVERVLITQARVPGFAEPQQVLLEAGAIIEIAEDIATDAPKLDLAEDWLSLGGVDLQINGALGMAFPDLSLDRLDVLHKIGQFLWQEGITGYCPTLVTTSIAHIHRALQTIAQAMAQQDSTIAEPTAKILGVHLEGPFLNPEKRGAHPAEFILPPTLDNMREVLGDWGSIVKIITLAPEMDPTGETISYLTSQGITVSLGHSQATAAQAQQAFSQGATMVTHAFNAMPGLHHREPGLLGAAIVDSKVKCGFIADGQHVVPLMIDLLLRASDYDRGLFLVSDALSPLGLPDGIYPWDERQIEVKQGTARLADGTLAGTTRSLLEGVKNLVRWNICDIGRAIALATLAPRRAIGLDMGYLGQRHLLRWSIGSDGGLQWQRFSGDRGQL